MHPPDEAELTLDGFGFRERENGQQRTVAREGASGASLFRNDDDRMCIKLLREETRRTRLFAADVRLSEFADGDEAVCRVDVALLGGGENLAHRLYGFHRILPRGGFAGEHGRIRLRDGGMRDVREFRAGGNGLLDHAFEHVRGDDDGLSLSATEGDDFILYARHEFEGDFRTQVAARDHDAVGPVDDVLDVVDGLAGFDLRDDPGVALLPREEGAQFIDVLRVAHERRRDEIDVLCDAERDVFPVLLGE